MLMYDCSRSTELRKSENLFLFSFRIPLELIMQLCEIARSVPRTKEAFRSFSAFKTGFQCIRDIVKDVCTISFNPWCPFIVLLRPGKHHLNGLDERRSGGIEETLLLELFAPSLS